MYCKVTIMEKFMQVMILKLKFSKMLLRVFIIFLFFYKWQVFATLISFYSILRIGIYFWKKPVSMQKGYVDTQLRNSWYLQDFFLKQRTPIGLFDDLFIQVLCRIPNYNQKCRFPNKNQIEKKIQGIHYTQMSVETLEH